MVYLLVSCRSSRGLLGIGFLLLVSFAIPGWCPPVLLAQGAGGAPWATGPTAMLASGRVVATTERLFSSANSLNLLQLLRVWDDLSSPSSFMNPCIEHGPSSCSLAECRRVAALSSILVSEPGDRLLGC